MTEIPDDILASTDACIGAIVDALTNWLKSGDGPLDQRGIMFTPIALAIQAERERGLTVEIAKPATE